MHCAVAVCSSQLEGVTFIGERSFRGRKRESSDQGLSSIYNSIIYMLELKKKNLWKNE